MRGDGRQGRTLAMTVVATVVAVTFGGCGGDEQPRTSDSPTPTPTPTQQVSSPATSSTPTPTPSGLSGAWTPNPGQADKVSQTLSAKGFQCTRHSDPAADLRLCSAAKKAAPGDNPGQIGLRFVSDAQGTVVLAVVDSYGKTADLEKVATEAVLPAADAAVLLADGTTLSWGTVKKDSERTYLTIKGWPTGMPYLPAFSPLTTTKEKALPGLQTARLKCSFKATDKWGSAQQGLVCKDQAFRSTESDGSVEGPTAELVLVDPGTGISQLMLEGRHAKVRDDSRAVRLLLPRAVAVDPSLQDVGTWVQSHLDGLPHSAYIGQWRVDVQVAVKGMLGDFVRVLVSGEKPDLGRPAV